MNTEFPLQNTAGKQNKHLRMFGMRACLKSNGVGNTNKEKENSFEDETKTMAETSVR